MPKYNKGDIVRLKSGGPKMTVVTREKEGAVKCGWFHEGEARVQQFDVETIAEVYPEDH